MVAVVQIVLLFCDLQTYGDGPEYHVYFDEKILMQLFWFTVPNPTIVNVCFKLLHVIDSGLKKNEKQHT